MAQQTEATDGGVRKWTDAQIITVPDDCEKPAYRAAIEKAAAENGHTKQNDIREYTFERCREFANSTMFAVWDTRK